MKTLASLFLSAMALFFAVGGTAQAADLNNYEKIMVNKVWITTDAVDNQGHAVPSTDAKVNAFFGIARYNDDGTFKILTQEGKPKVAGVWSISDDGSKRTLVAKKEDGSVLFTRDVENITVANDKYTYRVYPDVNDKSSYFDIIHKPLSTLW